MTRDETKQLLDILKLSYPTYYKNMDFNQAKETLDFYYGFFDEYDAVIVVQALRNYIKENKFPPTIAGLTEQINLLMPSGKSSAEYWNLILKAIRNSAYNSKEEFDKLPHECQMWLGESMALKDLSQIDSETVNTVIRGQFLKSINQIIERRNAQLTMNPELKTLIDGVRCKQLGGE